jgi:hypothetical protein
MNDTPHVAQNNGRRGGSAVDARTMRHASYAVSQKKRKRSEECFGWLKDIALLRKLKHRGLFKVGWIFAFAAAAYNLVRYASSFRFRLRPDEALVSLRAAKTARGTKHPPSEREKHPKTGQSKKSRSTMPGFPAHY